MSHTKGPWRIDDEKEKWREENGETYRIWSGPKYVGSSDRVENARLIAAAPEMLGMLKEIVLNGPEMWQGAFDKIEELIRKAEGLK